MTSGQIVNEPISSIAARRELDGGGQLSAAQVLQLLVAEKAVYVDRDQSRDFFHDDAVIRVRRVHPRCAKFGFRCTLLLVCLPLSNRTLSGRTARPAMVIRHA